MNKIFKVVWSKVRNCYVVVSEIAKNTVSGVGKRNRIGKVSLAATLAASVLTSGFVMPNEVWAAVTALETAKPEYYIAIGGADKKKNPFANNANTGITTSNNQTYINVQVGDQTFKYIYTTVTVDGKPSHYWIRDGFGVKAITKGYHPEASELTLDLYKIPGTDATYEGMSMSGEHTLVPTSVTTAVNGTPLEQINYVQYAALTNSGGTGVLKSYNYFINRNGQYVDVGGSDTNLQKNFYVFKADEFNALTGKYTFKGQDVEYDNVYEVGGRIGVFLNKEYTETNGWGWVTADAYTTTKDSFELGEGYEVYGGTVYGKYNEILLSGYNSIKADADCIEAIGKAFPVLFMTVAILISLTTMSRMIEEDRGLIGTYKALGFSDDEIRRKYVLYALIACIIGGIIGDFLAYIVLAEILFIVFDVMYQIPEYMYTFDIMYGIGGIIMFVAGIVGAAYVSCNSVLRSTPAMLMRAKPPSSGSRVLLERITPIWSRLSFLNKVTARNLFRYKKRLFMTLFGIAGCTALLLTGFTIKDTVFELLPLQYEETYRYDAMVVSMDNEKLLEYLEERNDVRKYINTMVSNVKLITEDGKEESVQLIVIPEDENISRYIRLYTEDGKRQKLTDDDVFVTTNLSMVMDFGAEDFVYIQNMNLVQADVEVTQIVMNYLGNSIYMTEAMYEECFDERFEPNAAYVLLNTKGDKQEEFAEALEGKDGILTVMGHKEMMDGFNSAVYIINMVVYIVIVLAGALAFVVLFTLATTNISERERELATIKVLGFYDAEVHSYVNKETLILTSLGIILGMPLGKFMGEWLMGVLEMPAIYFYPSLYPASYAYAAVIAIVFALMVNLITNKSLNKINPVEALKSIE